MLPYLRSLGPKLYFVTYTVVKETSSFDVVALWAMWSDSFPLGLQRHDVLWFQVFLPDRRLIGNLSARLSFGRLFALCFTLLISWSVSTLLSESA